MRSSTSRRPISGAEEKFAMEITPVLFSRLRLPSRVGFALSSHTAYLPTESRRLPDFLTLMKPRVMLLAVFTALVGLMIAPGHLDPLLGSIAILAIAAGAGAAGGLNTGLFNALY